MPKTQISLPDQDPEQVEAELTSVTDRGLLLLSSALSGPLAVSSEHFQTYLSLLRCAAQHEKFDEAFLDTSLAGFWDRKGWMSRYYRPYEVNEGVLTIPVRGALINKMTYQLSSYATGYEYIREALARGVDDPQVRGIAFDINSPGGEAAGMSELAGFIREQRGRKPMRAFANDLALSAAYWVGSAADDLTVSPSGMTGSVGVIASHTDASELLSNIGIEITLITAGKHKADNSPVKPLSKDARSRMQASVDKTYDRFVTAISENRDMTYEDVRNTEALVFDSDESLDIGFADEVVEFRHGLAEMMDGGYTVPQSKAKGTRADGADDAPETPAVDAEAIAAEARTTERKRFAAVQASDEYKGREALAATLLAHSDMSSEQIITTLASAERKQERVVDTAPGAKAKGNAFQEAMDKAGTPGVGAEEDDDEALAAGNVPAEILAAAGYKAESRSIH